MKNISINIGSPRDNAKQVNSFRISETNGQESKAPDIEEILRILREEINKSAPIQQRTEANTVLDNLSGAAEQSQAELSAPSAPSDTSTPVQAASPTNSVVNSINRIGEIIKSCNNVAPIATESFRTLASWFGVNTNQ